MGGATFRAKAAAGDPIFDQIFTEERWDVIPGAEPLDAFDTRACGAASSASSPRTPTSA